MAKSKRNYARLYCLLGEVMPQLDREEAKELVASTVSNDRTTSLRELTDEEFNEALEYLSRQLRESSAEVKKARSRALHQLQKYGIDTTDWDRVNAFVAQRRIAGKPFYHLDVKELDQLTNKMRAIISKSDKSNKSNKSRKQRPTKAEQASEAYCNACWHRRYVETMNRDAEAGGYRLFWVRKKVITN